MEREAEQRPFDPQRMVTATLEAERRMMTKAPEPEKSEQERDSFDSLFAKLRAKEPKPKNTKVPKRNRLDADFSLLANLKK